MSNFARNIGGSIGTSLLGTFLARQNQAHQQAFGQHTSHANPNFERLLNGLKSTFMAQGFDAVTATKKALAMAYQMTLGQGSALSFESTFWLMSVMVACLAPLPFLMRRPKRGEPQRSAAH
jgi:DHA2 family multidrug resistance protein